MIIVGQGTLDGMQPLTLQLCSNICKSICLKSKVSFYTVSLNGNTQLSDNIRRSEYLLARALETNHGSSASLVQKLVGHQS